jgi:hypothetical protein
MRFPRIICLLSVLTGTALLPVVSALADAIDGDWCFGARHLAIDGPDITTPGGKRLKGDYDRHGFRYVTPAGDQGAGQPVRIELQDDDHMTLQQGKAKPQLWKRCRAPTS